MSPGRRSPTTRSTPSTVLTTSIRPSRTAKRAGSAPSLAASSPGTRVTSAADRAIRSCSWASSSAKTSTRATSSAVTMAPPPRPPDNSHRAPESGYPLGVAAFDSGALSPDPPEYSGESSLAVRGIGALHGRARQRERTRAGALALGLRLRLRQLRLRGSLGREHRRLVLAGEQALE